MTAKLNEAGAALEAKVQAEVACLAERYAEVEALVAHHSEEAEKQQTKALETMTGLLMEMVELRAKNHSELSRRLQGSNEASGIALRDIGRTLATTSSALQQQNQGLAKGLQQMVRSVESAKQLAVDKENAQTQAWQQTMRDNLDSAKVARHSELARCNQKSNAIGAKLGEGW